VPNYCFCLGPREQAQIKLKVGITNTSAAPISIALSRFRLAVSHAFASEWTPKEPAASLEQVQGLTLVPANGDLEWEPFDGSNTFSTHWAAGSLNPGETFLDEGARSGDLVFYVPLGPNQSISLSGLALENEEGAIIAFVPFSSFGAESDPTTF
jgi:hypothetical protein